MEEVSRGRGACGVLLRGAGGLVTGFGFKPQVRRLLSVDSELVIPSH